MIGLTVYPIVGGILVYCIGRRHKKLRDYAVQLIALTHFFLTIYFTSFQPFSFLLEGFGGFGLHMYMGHFQAIILTVFSFAFMVCAIFSEEYFKTYRNRNRFYLFYLITLGAVCGVILAADLFTFFVFFEVMSFSSYVWVVHDETKEAHRAAETYLAVSVIGGLSILMGIFIIYNQSGTLLFCELSHYGREKNSLPAAVCILAGVGAKAGAFPLHIWLPKAHPVAPAQASALLSGVLTKTGIVGIMILFFSMGFRESVLSTIILIAGTITMLVGAVLALVSDNIKKMLACSSISQIGFILIGLSLGNQEGVEGSIFHMINHTLLKLVLFLAAGVVYQNIHHLKLNEIQGFGRKKPLLHFVFLAGALGIAGVPFGNAYFSKTLIHEGIIEKALQLSATKTVFFGQDSTFLFGVEKLFILAGGFTAAYMAKIYICLFLQKNQREDIQKDFDKRTTYISFKSGLVLTISASLLFIIGFVSAYNVPEIYFATASLKGIGISLFMGLLLYIVFVWLPYRGMKRYRNLWPEKLDLEDQIYRPVICFFLPLLLTAFSRIADRLVDYIIVFIRKSLYKDSPSPHELSEGTEVTHIMGGILDKFVLMLNQTIYRKRPIKIRFEHKLANFQEMISENNAIIARSLSFGLILATIGLLMTLIYLLL